MVIARCFQINPWKWARIELYRSRFVNVDMFLNSGVNIKTRFSVLVLNSAVVSFMSAIVFSFQSTIRRILGFVDYLAYLLWIFNFFFFFLQLTQNWKAVIPINVLYLWNKMCITLVQTCPRHPEWKTDSQIKNICLFISTSTIGYGNATCILEPRQPFFVS